MRGYRMHGPIGSCYSLPKPAGHQRAALPDSAVPQLPLGQRRLLQRLLHPHHRPLLLDEGRLAGQGPGAGRPPLSPTPTASPTSTRTSTPTRWNTPSPTAPSSSWTAAASPAATTSTPATRTAPRAWRSSPRAATAGRLPAPTRARLRSDPNMIWESKVTPDEQNPYQNEWNDLVDAIRNDKPYNEVEARRRSQPGDLDGPHGRPHRPGDHLRRRCSTASTSSPRTWTS